MKICLHWHECEVVLHLLAVSFDHTHISFTRNYVRILASTESFIKSSDFEYSDVLAASLPLKTPGVQKLKGAWCTFGIGFSKSAILWFKSYLQDRSFTVNIGKEYSNHGSLSCGVPQGSILGPLIFLLYVNDMARAVDCDLLLYADGSCLIVRGSSIEQLESILNKNFNALCDWFVENKLSIHFGEDKTKSILFSHKK